MSSVSDSLDRLVLRRPGRWLWLGFGLTVLLGAGLPFLEIETDGAAIHPSDSRTVSDTVRDRATFGEPEQVIVLLSSRDAAAMASPEGFRRTQQVHEGLQDLGVAPDFGVRSLASLLRAPAEPRSLALRPLLEVIPEEPAFRELLAEARLDPLTDGLLLSADGAAAALYVPLQPGTPRAVALSRISRWLSAHADPRFESRVTGPVAAEAWLGEVVLRDLLRLVPVMVAVIALSLALLTRTRGAVLVPLTEVLLVLVWTLGTMGWLGAPITLVTTILPVVLMTMALADEIHLLEHYRLHLGSEAIAEMDEKDARRCAMAAALGDVGWPIAVTSLTTAVAFLSFLSATTAPIRDFGVFCALGILLAMATSFTIVPALVVCLPRSWFVVRDAREPSGSIAQAMSRHPKLAWGASLAILLLAAPGVMRLTVQDAWTANFDPDSPLVVGERVFNDRLWGSYRFDVVLESEREGFFRSPAGARLVDAIASEAASAPHTGGVAHHLLIYDTLARLRGHSRAALELPPERFEEITTLANFVRRLVDLEQVLTRDGRSARLRLFVPDADYGKGVALRNWLATRLPPRLEAEGVDHHFNGDLPVALEVVDAIVWNQLRSLAWTLAGVSLLLALAFRSARVAVLAIAPTALAITAVLGGMGAAGMPLGIATSMFAALALGLGVDFAVHRAHAYERERWRGLGHERAVRTSLAGTRAIEWSAVSLTVGFLVLVLSAIPPNHRLGVLLASATLGCWALSVLWFPLLARGLDARGRKKQGSAARP